MAAIAGIQHRAEFINPVMVMNGGVAWFDLDNDSWDDLYLTGGSAPDAIYRNNGDGTFTNVAVGAGLMTGEGFFTVGVVTGDFDQNGHVDAVVTTDQQTHNLLYMNLGDGTFSEEALERGLTDTAYSASVIAGDFDLDGHLDLYFTNWRVPGLNQRGNEGECYPDRLYRNLGNGHFVDVTETLHMFNPSGCGLAAAFSDFDRDGHPDLLVANDFGHETWADPNILWHNIASSFTDVSNATGFDRSMNAMGIAVGDFDEDQDLDYYITDIGTNLLLRNDGTVFADITAPSATANTYAVSPLDGTLSWGWGTIFLDYDNDSFLDLFVANGFIASGGNDLNRMFRNMDATGLFQDVSFISGVTSGLMARGCAMADYDKDGDMDIFVVNCDQVNGTARSMLLQNQGPTGNWLTIDLVSNLSNPQAFGALVSVHFDGRTLIRESDGGSSYLSQNSRTLHFGLGSATHIDSITVHWPNTGASSYSGLQVNNRISLHESQGIPVSIDNHSNPKLLIHFAMGFVHINAASIEHVDIFDIVGREIVSTILNLPAQEFTIDATTLINGVYIVQTWVYGRPHSKRIAIVH